MEKLVDISKLAQGAIIKQIAHEIEKVIQNIRDPNTSPNKKRKMTIEIEFTPLTGDREFIGILVVSKSKLQPMHPVTTNISIDVDRNGHILYEEYQPEIMPGQFSFETKVIQM